MIIDAHSHVYPDHIAAAALGHAIPDMSLAGDGTYAGLVAAQDAAGLDRSCCFALAQRPELVGRANAFVAGLDRSRVIPIGTIHPALPAEENLAILRRHGMAGVKVHPVLQRLRLDDPTLFSVLAALAGEFAVIVHVGAGAGSDGSTGTPEMVRDIVRRLPRLELVACHFGGYHCLDTAAQVLWGERVHLDTSWPPAVGELGADRLREVIKRHGAERIVFASDWPTADPKADLATLTALGLAAPEHAAIVGGNAARLFGVADPG